MNFAIVINKGINAIFTIYTEGMDSLFLCLHNCFDLTG